MASSSPDLYGPVLGKVLYPAFEAMRGRPIVPLLRYLEQTQWWPDEQLRDLQSGLLRRLIRHASTHTEYYRTLLRSVGASPSDFNSPDDVAKLPLLTRDALQASQRTRLAKAPPFVAVRKQSSGTTGRPAEVAYNASSQYWRDAMRWRGYGWAGYHIGQRALHYWGAGPPISSKLTKLKIDLDHKLRRNLYIDCNVRTSAELQRTVDTIRRYRPQVLVAYSQGAAALARFINAEKLRTWQDFPVLLGAEKLWPHDRPAIEQAFGPAIFETYGSREFMLIGSECEAHDGMHTSMETLIVELVVQQADGSYRHAAAGETGDVVITDLQNLACPLIRFVNGDRAVAREPSVCSCGRSLRRIGPIDGRIAETLYDGNGNSTGGLAVSILFVRLGQHIKQFQLIQRLDRSVVMKVIPTQGQLTPELRTIIHDHLGKYLPGVAVTLDVVDNIPLTKAGKMRVVINEALTPLT
jgi:phenylacetate-CoA ligase